MTPRLLRALLLSAVGCTLAVVALRCHTGDGSGTSKWKNVYDTSVHYVGMDACRSCHEDIYATYIQTGMGQAFAPAVPSDARSQYPHAPVYDGANDLWYAMSWKGDKMHLTEYRLAGKIG